MEVMSSQGFYPESFSSTIPPDQSPSPRGFHLHRETISITISIIVGCSPYSVLLTLEVEDREVKRRGRSPRCDDQAPRRRDRSTTQKIRDLDARINAINTCTSAPVIVDALIKQTNPLYTERVMRTRVSSRFKLPTQLRVYEGKTDPIDHLNLYKSLMALQGYFDEVMCKAFSVTLKGSARSWFRKLTRGTIDSFGNKETKSLKDPVKRFNQDILEVEDPSDKVVELAEVKRKRRGRDNNKKEPETRRIDYRDEMKIRLNKLHPFHTLIVGFGGNMTHPLDWIKLPVTLGAEPHQTTVWQDFIVVDCPSPYNAILGQPTLRGVKVITLTYHLKMKFPTSIGIGEVKGDQKVVKQCFISAIKAEPPPKSNSL
ncbi:Pyrophosphate--fructose 6-phosphate 1-phosphotransferase [Actinidia chinensis var. chinensis]|uniref:Pyrophosphate--fructose 6-phosphate 1-phosphotransferase n=1 Tax=Actinidia chinensis var. chinensis TaxID=1590841 RepID=A0A2R6QNZ3_ACTCC|nr:Pyrophosphate--fructose 6-phosphate 1-phosphotransferase [Actinidia chinensis var. chinensis]